MAAPDVTAGMSPLRVFGAELRYYRTRAGLSQEQLGERLHFSGDLIGKIENGQRTPTEQFAAACDALPELATGGALTRLRTHLGEALKLRAYPGWFQNWPDKEASATTLRSFELAFVPGLLQTEDYARTMLQARVMLTSDELDELVAARMARQVVLTRDRPPMLWAMIDEGVLRRPVANPRIMRDQLGALAAAADQPNVVLQVVPLAAGAYDGLMGPFVLADFDDGPPAAFLETAIGGQVIEDSDGLRAVTIAWDTIRAEALPRAVSRALVEEVAATWV
jgi:DNA-binding XRE family transcriptional regulator